MARRTGIPSLIAAAREVCRLLFLFTPLIKELFPTNTNLHDALDAANLACGALVEELVPVREVGD